MALKITLVETRGDTSVPFYEHDTQFLNYLQTEYGSQIIEGSFSTFEMSDDGLNRNGYVVLPEAIAKSLDADPIVVAASDKRRLHNDANGIVMEATLLPT